VATVFIKRDALADKLFDERLHYSEDSKFILEIILSKEKYGILPEAIYYYRKRTSLSSALDVRLRSKAWYNDTVRYCYKEIVEMSMAKYGVVLPYVQYQIMYDMQQRMTNYNAGVLSEKEFLEYKKMIVDVLQYIDDDVILKQKKFRLENKLFTLFLKEKENEQFVYQSLGVKNNILMYRAIPLANLEKVCHSYHPKCTEILDADYEPKPWTPSLLSHDMNLSDIVLEDFKNKDVVIVQGPPGTGKTHRISQLCDMLCAKGFSVLVTALTNRALMEVADKLRESLIKEHKVYKTNLTTDEAKEVNGIQNAEKVYAIPGKLMLSTFYIASGSAVNGYEGPLFDYVIVDEASQAFFAMLAATNMLGYKKLWVGDVYQMPPIVLMSHDRIKRQGYEPLVNGLDTITSSNKYSNYQLSDTFRLGTNAAKLTGLFYKGALRSLAKESNMVSQKKEGPVIIPIDMPIGETIPSKEIKEVVRISNIIIQQNKKIEKDI